MIAIHTDPPIPMRKSDELFVQQVLLKDGDRLLGRARWCSTAPLEGVVQVLELWIDPTVRRKGHGHRLMRDLVDQARSLHRLAKKNVRRLWIGVGHETQVVGLAFLTSEGFHHISTTGGLLEGQDLLVYVKSLD